MAEGNALFELGMVVATPGALRLMLLTNVQPQTLLHRHVTGDWSEMDAEDQAANNEAVRHGLRIFSAYRVSPTERVWVLTEWDRSVTTFLKPSEY
jgi:hypothetical protein